MLVVLNKKIIRQTLVLILLLSCFWGQAALAQQDQFPSLAKGDIISSASELDYPPFCIVKDDGTADGFSVELLRAALKEVGYEVDFKVGPWTEVKNSLEIGSVRVLPLVGRTPEREAIFDFTVPYFSIKGAIFTRTGDDTIKTIEDLKDRTIVVMAGDNAEEYIRREGLSSSIITTTTYEDAFKLLSSGKYNAVISQTITGNGIIDKLKIKNVVALDIPLVGFTQYFAFAVKENDKEMLEKLNEGLSIISSNGIRAELEDKWIPKPLVQRSISLSNLYKYIGIGGVFLIFIFVVILILTLRIQIGIKTKKLIKELDERKNLQTKLESAQQEIQKKNKELGETLEDFYTMRIGIQKDLEAGRIEEENKKIKEKLDNIKKTK